MCIRDSSETSPGKYSHLPFLVMPMQTTSYFSLGMLRITFSAETSETSCSLETPPNNTATLIFAMCKKHPFSHRLRPMLSFPPNSAPAKAHQSGLLWYHYISLTCRFMCCTLYFIIIHKNLQAFFAKKPVFFRMFCPKPAGAQKNSKKCLTFQWKYGILILPLCMEVIFMSGLQWRLLPPADCSMLSEGGKQSRRRCAETCAAAGFRKRKK